MSTARKAAPRQRTAPGASDAVTDLRPYTAALAAARRGGPCVRACECIPRPRFHRGPRRGTVRLVHTADCPLRDGVVVLENFA